MKRLFIAALIPGLLAAVSCKKENIERPRLSKVMSAGNESDSTYVEPVEPDAPAPPTQDKGGEEDPHPTRLN